MLIQRTTSGPPSSEVCLPVVFSRDRTRVTLSQLHFRSSCIILDRRTLRVSAADRGRNISAGGGGSDGITNINSGSGSAQNTKNNNDGDTRKGSPPSSSSSSSSSSNYVVPLDKSSCITRPLAEILRDLNKRIPDNIIKSAPHLDRDHYPTFIPWYHANRMLSFYAPGWCGEIRDVIFSENGSVTVVYRVTIRGSDGEAHRESTGTVSSSNGQVVDLVAAAEEIAFCRACARFGLGLYLYHD
ncbi:DNA repair RAD52-like protein 2, chloroplastic [Coffea eugenioides]|uniref:DNA repair RAD52-like protein 2, chloroplastic n=1 Tax=Coffea arabica TaxID=13443 RepID=A0A6P6VD44_COFAR|nr:DNA repair RAD52-like protein 2, chloroplastic [Coffea arabica]XP_027100581.1 DNA repair RAD52-like protein 2, chloroplastic [Coffea arabica]XP_027153333.1 DNA repair RAD52-like protein 2, chloroplastic [Coffea eugenioides]